jgi:LuxR family maltose regulon positive regulatory protein
MSTPILATKLYIPPPQPRVVLRPRLIERLNEGLHRRLTLISAPAGFGKTTLLSGWAAGCGRPAGWLSLDEGDNDPARFLAYLVAALQTIAADIGESVLDVLQSPQPPPTESILTTLLNEITTIPHDFALVLDDYHVVDAKPVDDALAFLIEHLPPRMHLIIATREDPHLPLARLRARGQLAELRAADLRFTPSEAAEFLKEVMGLNLSAEDIAALETRTEGWIAGLQLAALSMRGREDVTGFVKAFAGDDRYIVDYLIEEVLQRQPERTRSFLLQTSILDRLSGPLCDAVTGQEDGRGMLEAVERSNLFVVPLDHQRRWYRYHHLFTDVLQARLLQEQPDHAPALHQRASEWYKHNGLPADAIRHALAARDFERAAELVEVTWRAMDRGFQSATWLGWAKALPDELVRVRPVLSAEYARALLNVGELEAAEPRLQDAERWLDTTAGMSGRPHDPSAEMVVVDEEQFRSLPATIATARAAHAQALGDVPGTVTNARRALDLLPGGDYYERGVLAAHLGVAYWASGDLEAAHRSFADFMANMRMAGNTLVAIGGTFVLADIRMAQGRLHEAVRTYERSLQLAMAQGEPVLRGTADLYLGLSELHCEQGDLKVARQHLLTSKELGERATLPELQYRSCVAMARIREAEGDLDGALDLLHEAERQYISSPVSDVRPAAALKARVWIAQGRLAEALGWAREQGLSAHDELSYMREFEHITLARMLIAHYRSDRIEHSIHEAMELLERLLQAAEESGSMGSVIEILMLQALAHEAQGDDSTALVPLERALSLAEPEGYVRVFVDEGTPIARLLYEALSHGVEREFTRRLLAAFPVAESEQTTSSQLRGPESALVEPLSARELEVLQLIAEGLTNRDVATRLYLSPHTVKVHTRNIFTKLAVKNRTQAVARGKALGILSQT